jgi:uncharacterized membrane protein YGL010W
VKCKAESGGLEADKETELGAERRKGSVESRLVEEKRRENHRVEAKKSVVTMVLEILDLEKQFSFYGAYHNNRVNILIHIIFVWPIFYTSLILWAYTAPLAPFPLPAGTLPYQEYMVLNWSFIQAAIYGLYYIALDKKAGSLGALICLGCWIGANAVAQVLPWSASWKIVLASQVTCWFFQVFGHQKFEGRAPALLDNLPQALLMAPFFVLLECLQSFGYEPYPGFQKKVHKNVEDSIREYRQSKAKKAT